MDNKVNHNGIRSLLHTILVNNISTAPFDIEIEELESFLKECAYLTIDDIQDMSNNLAGGLTRKYKSKIRSLAALINHGSLHSVADRIHYILDNSNISISEIRDILRGSSNDLPFEKIQKIGTLLRDGLSITKIAQQVEVSIDAVEKIENFLGIAEMRRLKLVDLGCDAVREGWSVRKFATIAGISKSTAHNIMKKSKDVLREIGELN